MNSAVIKIAHPYFSPIKHPDNEQNNIFHQPDPYPYLQFFAFRPNHRYLAGRQAWPQHRLELSRQLERGPCARRVHAGHHPFRCQLLPGHPICPGAHRCLAHGRRHHAHHPGWRKSHHPLRNGHFTEDREVTFANFADQYAFVMWQCGHPDFQVKKALRAEKN